MDPRHCVEGTAIGDYTPDFPPQGADSAWVACSDFIGEPLVVELGASWCGGCQERSGELEALSDAGYAVLVILYQDTGGNASYRADAAQWAEHLDLSYPDAVVTPEWSDSDSIPDTGLVDADGLVRWRHAGTTSQLL